MVYCKGSAIFLKFVDASDNIKDNKYIYGLLKNVRKEVDEANNVQIVTINICESWEIVNEEVQFILDSICSVLHQPYV